MNQSIAWVKTHWMPILAFAGAAWVKFGPGVEAWVSHHPGWDDALAFVAFTAGYVKALYMQPPKSNA